MSTVGRPCNRARFGSRRQALSSSRSTFRSPPRSLGIVRENRDRGLSCAHNERSEHRGTAKEKY